MRIRAIWFGPLPETYRSKICWTTREVSLTRNDLFGFIITLAVIVGGPAIQVFQDSLTNSFDCVALVKYATISINFKCSCSVINMKRHSIFRQIVILWFITYRKITYQKLSLKGYIKADGQQVPRISKAMRSACGTIWLPKLLQRKANAWNTGANLFSWAENVW